MPAHDDAVHPGCCPQCAGRAFDRTVGVCICLNVVALTLYSDPINRTVLQIYELLDYGFVALFALEAMVRAWSPSTLMVFECL